MKQFKAGIIGASGYSGEVLVEILAQHPGIKKLVVASRSHAGKRDDDVDAGAAEFLDRDEIGAGDAGWWKLVSTEPATGTVETVSTPPSGARTQE